MGAAQVGRHGLIAGSVYSVITVLGSPEAEAMTSRSLWMSRHPLVCAKKAFGSELLAAGNRRQS